MEKLVVSVICMNITVDVTKMKDKDKSTVEKMKPYSDLCHYGKKPDLSWLVVAEKMFWKQYQENIEKIFNSFKPKDNGR
jgi:hypothetical protein